MQAHVLLKLIILAAVRKGDSRCRTLLVPTSEVTNRKLIRLIGTVNIKDFDLEITLASIGE